VSLKLSDHPTYNLLARVAEYEKACRWLRDNMHLPEAVAAVYAAVFEGGGTLWFAGNGGSAADAQHCAAEYVGRFLLDGRQPLNAGALTVDTSVLTAIGNDFGFDKVFARQAAARVRENDGVVVHSTSGASENVAQLLAWAKACRPTVPRVALLGPRHRCQQTQVAELANVVVFAEVDGPAVQMAHMMFQHLVAEIVDYWVVNKFRRQKAAVPALKHAEYPP